MVDEARHVVKVMLLGLVGLAGRELGLDEIVVGFIVFCVVEEVLPRQ